MLIKNSLSMHASFERQDPEYDNALKWWQCEELAEKP